MFFLVRLVFSFEFLFWCLDFLVDFFLEFGECNVVMRNVVFNLIFLELNFGFIELGFWAGRFWLVYFGDLFRNILLDEMVFSFFSDLDLDKYLVILVFFLFFGFEVCFFLMGGWGVMCFFLKFSLRGELELGDILFKFCVFRVKILWMLFRKFVDEDIEVELLLKFKWKFDLFGGLLRRDKVGFFRSVGRRVFVDINFFILLVIVFSC